jgi:hypothetical protein
MALWFSEKQTAKVWKVRESHDNYSVVDMQTSSFNKRETDPKKQYGYSRWGFTRFVGEAHRKLQGIDIPEEGIVIHILSGNSKREPYYNADGEKVYPNIEEELNFALKQMQEKKVLASQRSLQYRHEQIIKNNAKLYNCSSLYAARNEIFQEVFFYQSLLSFLLLRLVNIAFQFQILLRNLKV